MAIVFEFGLFEAMLNEFELVGDAQGLGEDVAQVCLEKEFDLRLKGVSVYFEEGVLEESSVLPQEQPYYVLLGLTDQSHLLLYSRLMDEDGSVPGG